MAKKTNKTVFYCSECGYESNKWLGQCPACKSWNTFKEETISTGLISTTGISIKKDLKFSTLDDIVVENEEKIKTKIDEFDNLMGGGIVRGSITLIGGAPGIGKSTLLLQVVKNLGENNYKVLYVSGEESLKQIKTRSLRLGTFSKNIYFVSTSDLETVLKEAIKFMPDVLVIDSIQTMSLNFEDKVVGSITQVKACTDSIFKICKEHNISAFIVGHITKEGNVAGPKVLEHIVDTVLYFQDDAMKNLRLLRCTKNRFGSCDTLAVFEMTGAGLREIKNPSQIFLEERPSGAIGCVITCIIDSNRPLLLEIQALVTKSSFGMSRRTINGADFNKLNLLIAIIEKKMNLPLYEYDIYINITGGMKIKDPSIDLAIIMAIISSYKNKALGNDCIYCGEVGLTGEVRNISNVNMRVSEAIKLGYKKIFLPQVSIDGLDPMILSKYKNIEIKPISDVIS